MPLHRKFPNQRRFKFEFSNHYPVYAYLDNHGSWNVDTRFISHDLAEWIEEAFSRLFKRKFPELYIEDVLNLHGDEITGLFLLYATLSQDAYCPTITLSYCDYQEIYCIPGIITKGHELMRDDILDEILR